MEDKKNTKVSGKEPDSDNKSFDGTNVFKTGEVTKIIDEAISMIEERWNGSGVIRKVPDYHEMRKRQEKNKESGETGKSEENLPYQEIDKSDKNWIYREMIRLESEGKWQELERLTKSPEFLVNEQQTEYSDKAAETAEATEESESAKTAEATEESENAETAEPTGESGELNEGEDAEDTEAAQELDKSSKIKKRNKQSIVRQLKRVLIAAGLLAIALIAGRIIYVNCTYPSAKINMLNQSQKFTGLGCNIAVNDAVIYSKEKWVEYLKESIPEDEDFDADKYASIPGKGENYDILCAELSISNTTDVPVKMSDIKIGLVLQSGYLSQGYSIFIREKTDNSQLIKNYEVEPGQTRKFVFAYVLQEEFKKDLMLQYCELGNNQRMVLQLREVR